MTQAQMDAVQAQAEKIAAAHKAMSQAIHRARMAYRDAAKELKATRDAAIAQAYVEFGQATGMQAEPDEDATPSEPTPQAGQEAGATPSEPKPQARTRKAS
jgi:hypothetical protein